MQNAMLLTLLPIGPFSWFFANARMPGGASWRFHTYEKGRRCCQSPRVLSLLPMLPYKVGQTCIARHTRSDTKAAVEARACRANVNMPVVCSQPASAPISPE
eukprot:scaffold1326_cov17-Prasinocladus_malaysianus.AAC.1